MAVSHIKGFDVENLIKNIKVAIKNTQQIVVDGTYTIYCVFYFL